MEEFESKLTIHSNHWFWGDSEYIIYGHGEGIIHMQIQDDYADTAVLSGLSVIPAYRNNGLATKLLEFAEMEASKRGCKHVNLGTEKNTWLVEWYKRKGYRVVDTYSEDEFFEENPVVDLMKDI